MCFHSGAECGIIFHTMNHQYRFFKAGRLLQAVIATGDDVAALKHLDRRLWTALALPVAGIRFDAGTLKLLDSDGDGRIRVPEVLAAVDWLERRVKSLDVLFDKDIKAETLPLSVLNNDTPEGKTLLEAAKTIAEENHRPGATEITLGEIAGTEATFKHFADAAAYVAWCEAGRKDPKIMAFGADTPTVAAAVEAVEPKLDEFFAAPADGPLISESPDPVLSLSGNINPFWAARIETFVEKAAKPILGVAKIETITRDDWNAIKAKIAPYREWQAAKAGESVEAVGEEALKKELASDVWKHAQALSLRGLQAGAMDAERAARYIAHLGEFLQNFVNQAKLYAGKGEAAYMTGTLYIDARECTLCFHVDDEAAHSALAAKSKCCLLYAKLSRKGEPSRRVCAVVTAGGTLDLYSGRNGIFVDRDGRDWDATVTKVVEAQISLKEAFWAPWKKIFSTVGDQVRKFIGAKGETAAAEVTEKVIVPPAKPDGAALASSIAALSVGIGMAGAALAGLIGMVAGLPLKDVIFGLISMVLIVSLPSVVLTWFNLRDRDLGAILNAGGWAINRPLRFSLKLARTFTRTVSCFRRRLVVFILLVLAVASAAGAYIAIRYSGCCSQSQDATVVETGVAICADATSAE